MNSRTFRRVMIPRHRLSIFEAAAMCRCVEYSSGSKYTLVSATASAGPARPSAERSGAVTSVNLRVRPRTPPAAPAAAGAANRTPPPYDGRPSSSGWSVSGVRAKLTFSADTERRRTPCGAETGRSSDIGVGELRCVESVGEFLPVDPPNVGRSRGEGVRCPAEPTKIEVPRARGDGAVRGTELGVDMFQRAQFQRRSFGSSSSAKSASHSQTRQDELGASSTRGTARASGGGRVRN